MFELALIAWRVYQDVGTSGLDSYLYGSRRHLWDHITSIPATTLLLFTVVFKIIHRHQAIGSFGLILADRVSRYGVAMLLATTLVSSDTSLRRRLHLARMAIYSSTLTTIMATVVNDTFNLSSSSASTLTRMKAFVERRSSSTLQQPVLLVVADTTSRCCGRILVVSTSFKYSASRCKDARISLADFEPRPTQHHVRSDTALNNSDSEPKSSLRARECA
ncbi:hypothetical protein BDZ89DRAFT_1139570 [Hymenopellis radicata]|nr:hypothetical protein BDZ89DRAFT_1139570 [Hymenopellis radicata]